MSPRIVCCACILMLSAIPIALSDDGPEAIDSQVDAVTVYLDRAMVTRTAPLHLPPGRHQIVISHLPMDLEDSYLRAHMSHDLAVEGLHPRIQRPRAILLEGRQEIRDKMAEVQEEITWLQQQLSDNQTAQRLLESIQVALLKRAESNPSAESSPPPNLDELSQLLAFRQRQQQDLSRQRRSLQLQLKERQDAHSSLQLRLADLQRPAPPPYKDAVLTIVNHHDDAVEATLSLQYLLPGALWYPTYDIADLGHRAELSVAAIIQNATGEDWQQARITLSTARHDSNLMESPLQPWRILDETPTQTSSRTTTPQMSAQQSYSNIALASDNPEESLHRQLSSRHAARDRAAHQQLLANAAHIARMNTSLRQRSATVAIPVPGREHIPATGEAQRVLLGQFPLDIQRSYRAQPEHSASISSWGSCLWDGPWPLLPGDLQVQRNEVVLGHARLPFIAPGEAATVPLGLEERIVVRHRHLDEVTEHRIFSGSHRLHAQFQVEVHNLMEQAIDLHISVRQPTTNSSDVRLQFPEASPTFTSSGSNGVSHWQLDIAAQQETTLTYSFQAEWPTSLDIPDFQVLIP